MMNSAAWEMYVKQRNQERLQEAEQARLIRQLQANNSGVMYKYKLDTLYLLLLLGLILAACSRMVIARHGPPTTIPSATPSISVPIPTVTPVSLTIETATKPPILSPPQTRIKPSVPTEATASPTETVVPETAVCTIFPGSGILVQNGNRYTILEPLTGHSCPIKPAGHMEDPRLAAGQLYYVRFDEASNSRAVWRTAVDGSSQKLAFTSHLASEAFILDFLISEDGRQIAWTAVSGTVDATGEQQLTSDLWIANLDGTAPVQLLDDYGFHNNRHVLPLRFSEDGHHLYFALQPTGLGGIWTSYTGRYDSFYELALTNDEPTLIFDCQSLGLSLCLGDFRIEDQLLAYTDVPGKQINVITWQGTTVNSYPSPLESFFGFPTFGLDGSLLFYAATVDDDLFSRPGTLNLTTPGTAGTITFFEQEGLMLPLTWLDDRHILVLHAGNSSGGMAVVTTDGYLFPLTMEDSAYAHYLD